MSLEDELRNIKSSLEAEDTAQKRQEELKLLEETRKRDQMLKESQKISAERVEPYLQTINKVFANGKGRLIKPRYKESQGNITGVISNTQLRWNEYTIGSYDYFSEIDVDINSETRELIVFGNLKVHIDDPEYKQKFETALKGILSDKQNYERSLWNDDYSLT